MVTMGYGGGYATGGESCNCGGGGSPEMMVAPTTVVPSGSMPVPSPGGDMP
jgi:hypothetical protein